LSAGIALTAAVPIAIGYGGNGVTIAPAVTFVLSESGWVIMTGGCVLLGAGCSPFVASAVAIPAWMRWATAVAGLAAIAAAAWFPLSLVILWSVAVGIWLLVRGNAPGRVPATA
jgi:hypothetical protein